MILVWEISIVLILEILKSWLSSNVTDDKNFFELHCELRAAKYSVPVFKKMRFDGKKKARV